MNKTILVTGGLGYIGSHTVVELLMNDYQVVVVDNLCNTRVNVLDNIEKISGKRPEFYEVNVVDSQSLEEIFQKHKPDSVIHFAALKAVGESVASPLEYYANNIDGLLSVLYLMKKHGCNELVFSSSATVYGDPDSLPLTELSPLKKPTNPYGATKQMAEQIIEDVCKTSNIKAVALRYFNPIGAHSSALIGELPIGAPNNLVPYITQTAAGVRDTLTIYGDDYDTPDGSGVRDYIHVEDLAEAHLKALDYFAKSPTAFSAFNIGTGKGSSVKELVNLFESVNNVKVPNTVGPRRPGDIASCYASADLAQKELGWVAKTSIEDSLRSAWAWQKSL
jgi:UDP-glucose 4-epimerase